jgi:ferrous iron transport protein A
MTQNEKRIISLSKMGVNQSGIISSLEGGGKFQVRLQALNLRIGKRIKKISTNPFRGPIVIEIDQSRLALGHGMANKVMVEITGGDE